MTSAGVLERGRESFGRHAWADAYAALSAANDEVQLEPDDLTRLAFAAYLLGKDDVSVRLLEHAHRECLDRGKVAAAVRCAFWIALPSLLSGEAARAGGWLARARRLLDDHRLDCVEQGYLLIPVGKMSIYNGDYAGAHATFGKIGKIGERFGDSSLMAVARHAQGRALIRLGDTDEGLALLDETMVAITVDDISPIIAGMIYCSVIEACNEIFDARRAREWTDALSDWCASEPGLVAYRGQCLVHRSQVMQLQGSWPAAIDEVRLACERLSRPRPHPALGMAFYQLAELYRMRGERTLAEQAYRDAGDQGHRVQPGLALLRLAQHRIDAADVGVRNALEEAHDTTSRLPVLSAFVEIVLASGDIPAARAAAEELSQLAREVDTPMLHAAAAYAHGSVLLAEGDPRAALRASRDACAAWGELGAPYEVARSRLLAGRTCEQLGDTDSAEMDIAGAQRVFQQLGAASDLAALARRVTKRAAAECCGLTTREVGVLRLIARGKSNRAIAVELCLSERTVARHVSNIFTKLDLSSRSAATSYAYEHELT